MYVIHVFYTVE